MLGRLGVSRLLVRRSDRTLAGRAQSRRLLVVLACGWLGVGVAPATAAAEETASLPPAVAGELRDQLTALAAAEGGGETSFAAEVLRFYEARAFAPLWLDAERGLSARGVALEKRLARANEDGLVAEEYARNEIASEDEAGTPKAAARIERSLSERALSYVRDLEQGRIRSSLRPDLRRASGAFGAETALSALAAAEDPAAALDRLAAAKPEMARLKAALKRYRELAAAGGWPQLADGPTIEPGDSDPRVPVLRQRLAVTDGAAAKAPGNPQLYEPELVAAAKRFQQRHGLDDDGRIGKNSRAALNRTVEERIDQLVIALDSLRGREPTAAGPHLVINIPEFRLRLYEDGKEIMTMAVVVGRPERPTPILSSKVNLVVFNPSWTVPVKIAKEDLLPRFRSSPSEMIAKGFRVLHAGADVDPMGVDWQQVRPNGFPYVLRQSPGPGNALGRIRLSLPNDQDIYMHDTPDRHLLQREVRAYSSGCIRLERVLDLTRYLMSPMPKWTPTAIDAAIATSQTSAEWLSRPVPVDLVYNTAWVGPEGVVYFRDDIYGLDARVAQELRRKAKLTTARL